MLYFGISSRAQHNKKKYIFIQNVSKKTKTLVTLIVVLKVFFGDGQYIKQRQLDCRVLLEMGRGD